MDSFIGPAFYLEESAQRKLNPQPGGRDKRPKNMLAPRAARDLNGGMKAIFRLDFRNVFIVAACLALTADTVHAAEDRDAKVHNDRRDVTALGQWIYNDLPQALAEGKRIGKPLLVVLRCVP